MKKLLVVSALSIGILLYFGFSTVSEAANKKGRQTPQQQRRQQHNAAADSSATGLYIGGAYGFTNHDYLLGEEAAKGFEAAVEWRFNPFLALSAGYIDLGEESNTYNDGTGKEAMSVSGFAVSVLGLLPASEQVSIYGRVGLFSWDKKYKDVWFPDHVYEFSDSGAGPFAGLGLSVEFGRIAIRIEYDHFILDTGIYEEGYYDDVADRYTAGIMLKLF